jgi:large subunit ribosomal protein L30e
MNELIDALKSKKIVFGSSRTIKLLINDKIKKVLIASNCKEDIKDEIKHIAKIKNVEVVELDIKNNEIGVESKKPFSVSVLSLEK